MIKIDSEQNDTFKKIASLTSSKGLKKEGLFLLSGEKLIAEFLAKPSLPIVYEITTPKLKPLLTRTHANVKHIQLPHALYAQLDVLGTHFNMLVLEQISMEVLDKKKMASYLPRGLEVVLAAGDPGNLGALIRTCEAFGVPKVILTEEAAHPFLPKAVKASAGSVLRMPFAKGPALHAFPEECMALDKEGEALDNFTWPKKGLLVIGEEGPGLRGRKFKQNISIPTQGVESLNVVVAAGIALADKMRRSRSKN
jgi:TrmH family RNA methyltransferase